MQVTMTAPHWPFASIRLRIWISGDLTRAGSHYHTNWILCLNKGSCQDTESMGLLVMQILNLLIGRRSKLQMAFSGGEDERIIGLAKIFAERTPTPTRSYLSKRRPWFMITNKHVANRLIIPCSVLLYASKQVASLRTFRSRSSITPQHSMTLIHVVWHCNLLRDSSPELQSFCTVSSREVELRSFRVWIFIPQKLDYLKLEVPCKSSKLQLTNSKVKS